MWWRCTQAVVLSWFGRRILLPRNEQMLKCGSPKSWSDLEQYMPRCKYQSTDSRSLLRMDMRLTFLCKQMVAQTWCKLAQSKISPVFR